MTSEPPPLSFSAPSWAAARTGSESATEATQTQASDNLNRRHLLTSTRVTLSSPGERMWPEDLKQSSTLSVAVFTVE